MPTRQVRVAEMAEDVARVPLVRVGMGDLLETRRVGGLGSGNSRGGSGEDEGDCEQAQDVLQGEQ